jgi:UDP-GlcNAc:undecaprenyl-phosphate GlcNAc-1-phosphate transferase
MKVWLIHYLNILGVSFVLAYLFSFVLKYISGRINCLDRPDNKFKVHSQPTPRLGGMAIYLGFIGGILMFVYYLARNETNHATKTMLFSGLMALLVGLWDDFRKIHSDGLSAIIKLIILFVLTIILAMNGIIVNFPLPYAVNFILTLFWLVGCTAAFNAMDNMDGLASGLSLIAAVAYLAVAVQTRQFIWGILAAALIGSNLGFLFHNFHPVSKKPASIFMGDGGSFFLGFTLGTLSIMGGWSTNPLKAAIIPLLILGVPLLDFIYVIIRRQRLGITKSLKDIIVYSGTDHLSHRINQLGFSKRNSVLLMYFISFVIALGAVIMRNTSKLEAILLLLQFCLIFLIIVVFMETKAGENQAK